MASGHSLAAVMQYTPRQVDGLLFLADRRKRREAALELSIAATGARGDPKDVKLQIKSWSETKR